MNRSTDYCHNVNFKITIPYYLNYKLILYHPWLNWMLLSNAIFNQWLYFLFKDILNAWPLITFVWLTLRLVKSLQMSSEIIQNKNWKTSSWLKLCLASMLLLKRRDNICWQLGCYHRSLHTVCYFAQYYTVCMHDAQTM